jgi:hypothetical protein
MFAAVLVRDELVAEVERRAERVRAFYGFDRLETAAVAPRWVVGGPAVDTGMLVWGEPLPRELDVLDASDEQLRSLAGVTAVIAWDEARVRIVNNSAGPATLYVAEGDGVIAYATHAVAAALVAGVEPRLNEPAVAEFIALDFVGRDRTLVEGVRVVPPASAIDNGDLRTYWPATARWARVGDAYEHTERTLLETLEQRTRGATVGLALTGGLDSTVGAAALAEIGAKPLAFTWGAPKWADARAAAATAARLGFDHEVLGVRMLDDDTCLAELDREVRWTDGMAALSAAERHWPEGCDALVVGMGGETGRAFYYDAWSALLVPNPSREGLARRLGVRGRLRGATEDTVATVEQSVAGWVDEAIATGAQAWDVLDVLYTEQRVRRWGRSQVPPLSQNLVLLFTPAEIARGLFSLPVRERIRDGFHRRFLSAHGFTPGDPDVPDPGRIELALRRLRARRQPRPAPAAADDPLDRMVEHVWTERPNTRDWVREEALRDPLIERTLGREWAAATARGFSEGRARTAERALRAAGVVAFARALRALG